MPVASGGRVLPLDSLARAQLRQLRMRESALEPSPAYKLGDRVPAIEWMADLMFAADGWKKRSVFRIDDPVLRAALNLSKRKGYSYSVEEIEAAEDKLQEIIEETEEVPANQLDAFQAQALVLSRKLTQVRILQLGLLESGNDDLATGVRNLIFAAGLAERSDVPLLLPVGPESSGWSMTLVVEIDNWLKKIQDENALADDEAMATYLCDETYFKPLVTRLAAGKNREDVLKRRIARNLAQFSEEDLSEDEALERLDRMLATMPEREVARIFDEEEQRMLQQIRESRQERASEIFQAIRSVRISMADMDATAARSWSLRWQALAAAYRDGNTTEFNQLLEDLGADVNQLEPLGWNASKIGAEWWMKQTSPFFISGLIYILAIVTSLFGWIFSSLASRRLSYGLITIAVLVQLVGLLVRIYVSGRPPVTNLYSSATFISWALALSCLVGERFSGRGLFNMVAAVGGWLTLYIASSLANSGDTIGVMRAVLDTQFWLATHVVIISLGYAGTYLGAGVGALFVLTGLLTTNLDSSLRKSMAKSIHLITMLSLLLSFFGTVLGGLWADDSWGRFWGWDPKENGALMIVLWNAVALHARWGGIVKDRGFALLAILGAIVVSWSWFAVNELGVGLHSYGQTEGTLANLGWASLISVRIVLAGMIPLAWWPSMAAAEISAGNRGAGGVPANSSKADNGKIVASPRRRLAKLRWIVTPVFIALFLPDLYYVLKAGFEWWTWG